MTQVLYVAGPMTGLPEFNLPAFHAAEYDLAVAGFDVVNPAHNGAADVAEGGAVKPWSYYMRLGLEGLLRCDGVATLDGWWMSRGALLEVQVARALQMPVDPVDRWVARGCEA